MQNITRRGLLFGEKLAADEEGTTALEYGLIAALISVGIILGVRKLGNRTNRKFRCASNSVKKGKMVKACKAVKK